MMYEYWNSVNGTDDLMNNTNVMMSGKPTRNNHICEMVERIVMPRAIWVAKRDTCMRRGDIREMGVWGAYDDVEWLEINLT